MSSLPRIATAHTHPERKGRRREMRPMILGAASFYSLFCLTFFFFVHFVLFCFVLSPVPFRFSCAFLLFPLPPFLFLHLSSTRFLTYLRTGSCLPRFLCACCPRTLKSGVLFLVGNLRTFGVLPCSRVRLEGRTHGRHCICFVFFPRLNGGTSRKEPCGVVWQAGGEAGPCGNW